MNNSLSIWTKLHHQAVELAQAEPMLSSHYHQHIINHDDFASALACHLAAQLGGESVSSLALERLFLSILGEQLNIIESALQDKEAYYQRDPACDNYCRPFLLFTVATRVYYVPCGYS